MSGSRSLLPCVPSACEREGDVYRITARYYYLLLDDTGIGPGVDRLQDRVCHEDVLNNVGADLIERFGFQQFMLGHVDIVVCNLNRLVWES